MDVIDNFDGEFGFLSNFAEADITVGKRVYKTIEHAFQALKTVNENDREKIHQSPTPGKAKRLGRKVTMRPNWDNLKTGFMLKLLKQKFSEPKFRELLINTGDVPLIEANHWHDNYWGDCRCSKCENKNGQNVLGHLLMQVRDLLNKGQL